jgi:hypothetical protein
MTGKGTKSLASHVCVTSKLLLCVPVANHVVWRAGACVVTDKKSLFPDYEIVNFNFRG